jgi:CRP/FNR family transcriptional regulator, cyclic AMP receptor protein
MDSLEKILAEQSLVAGLASGHLRLLAGCASNVRFEPEAFIFREGEQANTFLVLRHGQVAIEVFTAERGPVRIETLGGGDLLGWSWLVPPYRWHFDVRAIEMTRAIALDARCLRQKCEEDHDLGYLLFKRFSHVIEQRLQATRLQLLEVYGAA